MRIALIAATDLNGVIGKNNSIPWHNPADMALFKQRTWNNIVIMGRKTHESIGKVLPSRFNIVITSDLKKVLSGALAVKSLKEGIWVASHILNKHCSADNIIFLIGGEQVYNAGLDYAEIIYKTTIRTIVPDGDTYFPVIDILTWNRAAEDRLDKGKNLIEAHLTTYVRDVNYSKKKHLTVLNKMFYKGKYFFRKPLVIENYNIF